MVCTIAMPRPPAGQAIAAQHSCPPMCLASRLNRCRHVPVATSTVTSSTYPLEIPCVTSMAIWRLSGLQAQCPRVMVSGPESGPGTGRTRSLPRARSRTRRAGRLRDLPDITSQASLPPSGEIASVPVSATVVTFSGVPPVSGSR
jgi:hypothetical protein